MQWRKQHDVDRWETVSAPAIKERRWHDIALSSRPVCFGVVLCADGKAIAGRDIFRHRMHVPESIV